MTESTVNGTDENEHEKETVSDKDLPLSFMQDRHLGPIEGVECITQTWRMKERVSRPLSLCTPFYCYVLDENRQCSPRPVLKRRRGPPRRAQNAALRPPRVLDR